MRPGIWPVVLLLALLPLSARAQSAAPRGGCGNSLRPEHVPLLAVAQAKREEAPRPKAGTWYFVPVSFHIVRKSNGGQGLDPGDLPDILDTLNDDYAGMQIRFYAAGPTNYIDDDALYEDIDTDAEVDALRQIDTVPSTINIYFVKEFADDDGPLCGISSFSFLGGPQGIVMDEDCTVNQGNPSTMTHEVGHYFDLLHTHETANGNECADGSNCSFAGDQLCDTPADPELGSHNVSNCGYTGSERDSCNNDLYSPLVDNFMAYSPENCRTSFTNGQETRALGSLVGARADHITMEWSSSSAIYVDHRNTGAESGSSFSPYDTVSEGVLWAQITGARLVILAGGSYPDLFTAAYPLGDVTLVPTAGQRATMGE